MRPLAADLLTSRSEKQWSLVAHDGGDVLPLGSLPSQVGRHPGVAESISAALGNVNPYTLFDAALAKDGADLSPAFDG